MFVKNCLNCYVGGVNLVNFLVFLFLVILKGVMFLWDNLNNLVVFLRDLMIYDGISNIFFCC